VVGTRFGVFNVRHRWPLFCFCVANPLHFWQRLSGRGSQGVHYFYFCHQSHQDSFLLARGSLELFGRNCGVFCLSLCFFQLGEMFLFIVQRKSDFYVLFAVMGDLVQDCCLHPSTEVQGHKLIVPVWFICAMLRSPCGVLSERHPVANRF